MTHTDPTVSRIHGLDALRGFALIAGVALHLSLSWLPGSNTFWMVSESDSSLTLSFLFWFTHSWRMLLFFLIAGFFGRLLHERLGTRAFIRDRFRRIGTPLFAGWPMVFAAIIVVFVWAASLAPGGLPKETPPGPKFTADDFPLTHLWFLWCLLLSYAGMLVMRWLIASVDRRGRFLRLGDLVIGALLCPGVVLVLAAPLAWALTQHPQWMPWFGIPTPDHSLYPNLPAVVGYGSAFVFGWWLQRQPQGLRTVARWTWWNVGIAILCSGGALSLVGLEPMKAQLPDGDLRILYACLYAGAGWTTTLALLGVAVRYLTGVSIARRYLADASYWIYLAHLPIVMAASVVTSLADGPWWLEFPIALGVCMAILLGTYQLFVRYSALGSMLHGKRRQRKMTATAAGAPENPGTFSTP